MARSKINYGDCVGCDQPIRPPYLSFVVNVNHAPDGNSTSSWEEADVCDACAAKLTVRDFFNTVTTDDDEEVAE